MEEKGKPRDVEKAFGPAKDANLVTWESSDDPENPRNWARKKKWSATLVVAAFAFMSPLASTMMAPALGAISKQFNITSEAEVQITLSVFVLAYAFGPLVLGPLSEIYGRVPVLQLSNFVYIAFNFGCGFSQSTQQLIIFRLFAGLGGSSPLTIGGAVLADCWKPEERGRALSIYALAPLLGPVVGPIAGGFITERTTWRWIFWAIVIANTLIQALGLVFLRETYVPQILHWKAERLKKETGNQYLYTEYGIREKAILGVLKTSFIRPFRLLGTQVIVQILGIYMAYLYGTTYLVLATFPTLWQDRYGESIGIAGLNYISLGLGFYLGANLCAAVNDRIYRALKKRQNDVGRPEFRTVLMMPASFFVPIGLFWYGWSAQAHVHWIMPNIGVFIFGIGVVIGFVCIQTFLVDVYPLYAASAVAAATVLRSLASFGFPLFAPVMYDKLGYGWGNSVLAFVAIVLGVPGPIVLWKFGERLRAKSQYAAGGGIRE